MDPMVRFLKDDLLPEENLKRRKYEEKLLISGCPRTTNCINAHILGHIYCVSTLRHQNYCLKSCTKGSMGVTQEEDLCRTEPLPRDIGGRGCRRKPWNMLKSVTSAKGSLEYSSARLDPQSSDQSIVVRPMGPRYYGTFPKGTGK